MNHVALVMSLNKRFDRKVIEGVTRFVRESGDWSVFLEDDPQAKIPDFHHGHFNGVIADLDDPRIPKRLVGLEIPAVGVGAIRDDCSCELNIATVSTNNRQIAVLAANHLIERGLQHFAYCGVPGRTIDPWNLHRREAFVQHLRETGYECSVYSGRINASHSWEQLQEELAAWLAELPKPLGLMAANDARARHVLEACRRLEIRVPEDIAVIGVDNDELICNLAHPPLTSIVQGTEEIGYRAAELLNALMNRQIRRNEHLVVDPVGVITRQSTDLVATEDVVASTALAYIRQHAVEGIQVADVARASGVSRSTLDARFRRVVGRTVHEEIQRSQLNAAQQLLVTTNLPVEEIARRAGFATAQYMNAVFQRAIGQTPGRYRLGAR
ncbi:MAG: DNA-binding transcriptional regulator [Planctomycetaceae bacterium]|nr:DNA-binding transcriptional regulator [Planctomycetaceae bacterium]